MISKGFLISVLGVTMVLLLASIQDMLAAFRSAELVANGYHDNLIAAALGSEAMALSLPILCALPFTASFVDDMKSGYIIKDEPNKFLIIPVWDIIGYQTLADGSRYLGSPEYPLSYVTINAVDGSIINLEIDY